MSVCLGIAVDDTIHILSNYNRLRQTGMAPQQAMTEVFNHTGPALVLTTLILVAGFGTFALATFIPNLYFGVMCAIILTVALFTDFTFLPALLTAAVPEPKSESEPESEPDSEFEGQESKLQPTSFGS